MNPEHTSPIKPKRGRPKETVSTNKARRSVKVHWKVCNSGKHEACEAFRQEAVRVATIACEYAYDRSNPPSLPNGVPQGVVVGHKRPIGKGNRSVVRGVGIPPTPMNRLPIISAACYRLCLSHGGPHVTTESGFTGTLKELGVRHQQEPVWKGSIMCFSDPPISYGFRLTSKPKPL